MTLNQFKRKKHQYLGFDEQKGYIYSVEVKQNEYQIIAVKRNEVEVLITYRVKGE